jgi:hypothetical protein
MSYGTVQAEKMTTESGFSLGAGNSSSFKNRLINGEMDIAQRGTSFTGINNSNTDAWPADRFRCRNTDTVGTLTVSNVADAPAGFINSARVQVTTVNATPNNETFIEQIIEGNNLTGLAYGTASAQSFTLSFWAKVSVTGTYNVWIYNPNAGKAVGFSYSVSSANTWTQISATIAGDTVSALASNNSEGIYIRWYLDSQASGIGPLNATWSTSNISNRMVAGSVRLLSTLNATYQFTGAQFEVGTVATSFDYRPFGTELVLCQRYYEVGGNNAASQAEGGGTSVWSSIQYKVNKRANPTIGLTNSGLLYLRQYGTAGHIGTGSAFVNAYINSSSAMVRFNGFSGLSVGAIMFTSGPVDASPTVDPFFISAEL